MKNNVKLSLTTVGTSLAYGEPIQLKIKEETKTHEEWLGLNPILENGELLAVESYGISVGTGRHTYSELQDLKNYLIDDFIEKLEELNINYKSLKIELSFKEEDKDTPETLSVMSKLARYFMYRKPIKKELESYYQNKGNSLILGFDKRETK